MIKSLEASKQAARSESESLRKSLREMFIELQEMTRLRLEAEALASSARVEVEKRDCHEKMRQLGFSPAKSAEEHTGVLAATQKDAEGQLNHLQQAAADDGDEEDDQEGGVQKKAKKSPPVHLQHLSDALMGIGAAGAADAGVNHGAEPMEIEEEKPEEEDAKDHVEDEMMQFSPIAPRAEEAAVAEVPATEHSKGPAANGSRSPGAPIIVLSGFGENNSVQKLRLSRAVESLGGSVFLGKDMNDCITHVVSPAAGGQKTVRALAAELMGRWCVTEEWIVQSLKAGKFVSEEPFGKRNAGEKKPFENTLFYLHSTFVQNPKHEEKVRLARQLIVLAGGQLVDQSHNVEPTYRLVSKEHGKTRPSDLFWSDMLAMLTQEEPRKTTPSKKRQRRLNFDDQLQPLPPQANN